MNSENSNQSEPLQNNNQQYHGGQNQNNNQQYYGGQNQYSQQTPMQQKTSTGFINIFTDMFTPVVLSILVTIIGLYIYHTKFIPKVIAEDKKIVAVDFVQFMLGKEAEMMVSPSTQQLQPSIENAFNNIKKLSGMKGVILISGDVALANIPVIKLDTNGNIKEVIINDDTGKHLVNLEDFLNNGKTKK